MAKQTKLTVRIQGKEREDFYLNILGMVTCLQNNIIAMKMHNDDSWTLQGSNGGEDVLRHVILRSDEANKFIESHAKVKFAYKFNDDMTLRQIERLVLFEGLNVVCKAGHFYVTVEVEEKK